MTGNHLQFRNKRPTKPDVAGPAPRVVLYTPVLFVFRDHPSTIKKRFISVFSILCISPLFVVFGADLSYFKKNASIAALLGLRLTGLVQAILLPLMLTMVWSGAVCSLYTSQIFVARPLQVLFAGPLTLHYFDGVCRLYLGKSRTRRVFFCALQSGLARSISRQTEGSPES